MYIVGVCSVLLAFGAYFIVAEVLKLPSRRAYRAIAVVSRREKKKTKKLTLFIDDLSMKCGKLIRLGDYKKRMLLATLKSADIAVSPETYIARAWIKAGITLLFVIPALALFPLLFPVILFLAVAIYFKEIRSADEAVKERREEIEYELPRFVATLTQELRANRNILTILDTYKQHACESFKKELEITVADMRSGSYEAALTRWEIRLGSPKLSEVVRGLVGVLRGDDSIIYFHMLAHDLKQLEFQRLKTLAMKRPGKIRKYSFTLLFCFLLMYMSVLFMEIMTTLETMF